jgi:hypothetical protein
MYRLRGFGDVTATVPAQDIPVPPMAACPAGYGVGTFQMGLQWAFKALPLSLLNGPINLMTATPLTSGSGNIVGPDGVTPCHQSENTLPKMYYFGQALPGLALVAMLAWWLFGSHGSPRRYGR